MQTGEDPSGDYVLPVGMTGLQKKVTSAVVSSNFSEILSYFDGTQQSREKYTEKLTRMLHDLDLVATHPFLLLENLQPSLTAKRAPTTIETMSGKFQTLVMVARRFSNPDANVAVVCEAGQMTDLVESLLADRGLNVSRYSVLQTKIYKKEQKRRGAAFHLIPSDLKDLRSAVYAAFDLMILLDNSFDVDSAYGRGLRMQLRDPSWRRPYAPVLRLVPLNTIQHYQLDPQLSFSEQISHSVVFRKQAGSIPSAVKQYYSKDLAPLQSFINNPDGHYPLPPLSHPRKTDQKDVELALYLDDEDQYQVDFAERRAMSGRRQNGADSDDEESGDVTELKISELKTERDASMPDFPIQKRRRVELETTAIEVYKDLSRDNPLSVNLIVQLNDALEKARLAETEVESHRLLATERENVIQSLRDSMKALAERVRSLETSNSANERRSEKLQLRNGRVESELRDTEAWWQKLSTELKLQPSSDTQVHELTLKILDLEAQEKRLRENLLSEQKKFATLQASAHASSEFGDRISKEKDALLIERDDLQAQLNDAPMAKELALEQQLKARRAEVTALRSELDNLRESVKVQLSQERAPMRGDRRFGRGGRGVSRQASPLTASSNQ